MGLIFYKTSTSEFLHLSTLNDEAGDTKRTKSNTECILMTSTVKNDSAQQLEEL